VTGSNELVDATTTSADEPSGSDRIYLLRSHHCVGIEIWAMRRTDIGDNLQAQQEAQESGGEIATTGQALPSGVTIEGDAIRLALLPKHLCHGLESGLSMKMGVNVRSHQDGGSHIHDIQNFDHMLLLAIRISRDGGGVECASICQLLIGSGRSRG